MNELIKFLPDVVNAVKDNQFGLIIAAVFVIALVVITLAKGGQLFIRIVGMILVFLSAISLSAIVLFQNSTDSQTGQNGSFCIQGSDCISGECYPGPHPKPNGSGKNYCVARDRNCALPGFDGVDEGTSVYMHGSKLTCVNPGDGFSLQLVGGV